MRAEDFEMAAGYCGGDGIGSGFDPVHDQFVTGVMKRISPLDKNAMSPNAINMRPHAAEAKREVANFGIASAIENLTFTARCASGHQCSFGSSYRRRGQDYTAAAQSRAFCTRVDVTS